MKLHKSSSSSSSSVSELTAAAPRNSFSSYAAISSKSAAAQQTFPCLSPTDAFDIDDEPTLDFAPNSTFVPRPPPKSTTDAAKLKPPSGSHPSSCFASTESKRRLDLAAARRDYEQCKTEAQKAELKSSLRRRIVRRLKELSEMEAKSNVGIEIADSVDFLKLLYHGSSDSAVKELGEIREKSRQGVVRLQEGQLLVKKSQDQLRSALHNTNGFLFSAE